MPNPRKLPKEPWCELLKMDVFDANRVLPKDPNEEWPKRDPPKDELLKLDPPECKLPKCDPLKPVPP